MDQPSTLAPIQATVETELAITPTVLALVAQEPAALGPETLEPAELVPEVRPMAAAATVAPMVVVDTHPKPTTEATTGEDEEVDMGHTCVNF